MLVTCCRIKKIYVKLVICVIIVITITLLYLRHISNLSNVIGVHDKLVLSEPFEAKLRQWESKIIPGEYQALLNVNSLR